MRSAIRQELDRGGQVFYVVPRVEGIEEVAGGLRQMLPGLRLLVAHGQMPEGELESAMVAFNAGEADVMLCTTIVESGLDIPRVNTILIEDSQKFGLSQLYQLRGRVGRSGIQAHAWLFYPGDASLSDAARQRLRAIQEFAQLGSGYQLAMRDMEIRGVGNLLGVEQSGQMETIGFDLYMEMLQEELAESRGQDIPAVDDTQIDLSVTAFIPADWVTEADEKMAAYRAAADCDSREGLLQLAADWVDRWPAPGPGAVAAATDGDQAAGQALRFLAHQARNPTGAGNPHGRARLPPPAPGFGHPPAWPFGVSSRQRHHREGARPRPWGVGARQAAGRTQVLAGDHGGPDP